METIEIVLCFLSYLVMYVGVSLIPDRSDLIAGSLITKLMAIRISRHMDFHSFDLVSS